MPADRQAALTLARARRRSRSCYCCCRSLACLDRQASDAHAAAADQSYRFTHSLSQSVQSVCLLRWGSVSTIQQARACVLDDYYTTDCTCTLLRS